MGLTPGKYKKHGALVSSDDINFEREDTLAPETTTVPLLPRTNSMISSFAEDNNGLNHQESFGSFTSGTPRGHMNRQDKQKLFSTLKLGGSMTLVHKSGALNQGGEREDFPLGPKGLYKKVDTSEKGRPLFEFNEEYELLPDKVLGKGAQGQVLLANVRNPGKLRLPGPYGTVEVKQVAVKIIEKRNVTDTALNSARTEAWLLLSLRHHNIVRAFDFFEDDYMMYIVLEYVSGGKFINILKRIEDFNEGHAREIMWRLLQAMKYCWAKGITHRDLKPANILLRPKNEEARQICESNGKTSLAINGLMNSDVDSLRVGTTFFDGQKLFDVVIADFGISSQVDPNKYSQVEVFSTARGTYNFMAPEMFQGGGYGYKVDIYALGVVMYCMLSGGCLPFKVKSFNDRPGIIKVINGNFEFTPLEAWSKVSDQAKSFIKLLMTVDPSKRPTYEEALNNEFFIGGKTFIHSEPISFARLRQNYARYFQEKEDLIRKAALQFSKFAEFSLEDVDGKLKAIGSKGTEQEMQLQASKRIVESVKNSKFQQLHLAGSDDHDLGGIFLDGNTDAGGEEDSDLSV